jgi:hypothetical protein
MAKQMLSNTYPQMTTCMDDKKIVVAQTYQKSEKKIRKKGGNKRKNRRQKTLNSAPGPPGSPRGRRHGRSPFYKEMRAPSP